MKKIRDQYKDSLGDADQKWGENRQNALYKIADTYNAADDSENRKKYMQQGNSLNDFIANSAFLSPEYTGETREMATPELGNYAQNIAKYSTIGVGGNTGTPRAGNMAVRAIAVNDKDFGVKKKTEGDLGYGV